MNATDTPPAAVHSQPEPIQPNAVYLTDEAAQLLRISPDTLKAQVRMGRVRAQGKPYRFLGSELLKIA